MTELTEFQLFTDHGLVTGDTPIGIWLTRLPYYYDRLHEARLSRACLKPKQLPPHWKAISLHDLQQQYVRIGQFYDSIDNNFDVPADTHPDYMDYVSWCYNIAHGWPDYVTSGRQIDPAARREYKRLEEFAMQCGLPVEGGEHFEEFKDDTRTVWVDTPTRSLKAHIGDILELPTGFWIILGCGFAKVTILSGVTTSL